MGGNVCSAQQLCLYVAGVDGGLCWEAECLWPPSPLDTAGALWVGGCIHSHALMFANIASGRPCIFNLAGLVMIHYLLTQHYASTMIWQPRSWILLASLGEWPNLHHLCVLGKLDTAERGHVKTRTDNYNDSATSVFVDVMRSIQPMVCCHVG